MVIQVIVCAVDGVKMTIAVCQDEKQLHLISVMQLKKKISEKLPGSPGKAADGFHLGCKKKEGLKFPNCTIVVILNLSKLRTHKC